MSVWVTRKIDFFHTDDVVIEVTQDMGFFPSYRQMSFGHYLQVFLWGMLLTLSAVAVYRGDYGLILAACIVNAFNSWLFVHYTDPARCVQSLDDVK